MFQVRRSAGCHRGLVGAAISVVFPHVLVDAVHARSVSRSVISACVVHAFSSKLLLPLVLLSCNEWFTFLCTHTRASLTSVHWKSQELPHVLKRLFANGFKNPLGALAIGGTFYFPAAIYALVYGARVPLIQPLCVLLGVGRAVALASELYFGLSYLARLVELDVSKQ
jgi:hypothetical protein